MTDLTHEDIRDAIKLHEDTLHKDMTDQVKALNKKVESLSSDINATGQAVITNGKNVKKIADAIETLVDESKASNKVLNDLVKESKGVITAWNGAGWLKHSIIEIGKLSVALVALGGLILGAFHSWSAFLELMHMGGDKP